MSPKSTIHIVRHKNNILERSRTETDGGPRCWGQREIALTLMDHKWLLRNKDIQCDKEEFGKNDRKPAMENKIRVDVLPEFIWPPVLSCVCSFKSHQRLSMHKWICHSSIRESIRITSSSLFFPCIQSCLLPSILLFFLIRHNHRPTQFSAAFIISKIEAKYVIRADAHVARKRVFKHNITAFVYTWRCWGV